MYKVAISAGHNPGAKGAVWGDVSEYDETVLWQEQLLKAFAQVNFRNPEESQIQAIPIATGTLGAKVREINSHYVDLAVEVHFNAAGSAVVSGCETLFYPGSKTGEVAAKVVQLPLAEAMKARSRGVKPGWYRMDRPGVVDFYGDEDGDEMPDYFLKATNCTALILEPEFLSQIEKIRELRVAGCWAIAKAISRLAGEKHAKENPEVEDEGEAEGEGEEKAGTVPVD